MFAYVALSLGKFYKGLQKNLVESRLSLALGGILIVVSSIIFSVSLFILIKVKTTLIIAEVIPFLVLAIGVDNIFLIVHSFDQQDKTESVDVQMAKALEKIGPNILITALSEAAAFLAGSIVPMPAVSSFSLYAAVAIFVDFILQMTCFIAFLSLNEQRVRANRVDLVPFIKVKVEDEEPRSSLLESFFSRYLVPTPQKVSVRISLLLLYFLLMVFSISGLFRLEMGLDQKLALPNDSYLIPYFNDISEKLLVGPPLYFVLKDVAVESLQGKLLIAGRGYKDLSIYSISSMLEVNRKQENSYIASPTAVWLDDYFSWSSQCCTMDSNGDYDPESIFPCQSDKPFINETLSADLFYKFIPPFLSQMPNAECPYAGGAAYSSSIHIFNNSIAASHFRTYLTPLKTQADFINSYRAAKFICQQIIDKNVLKEGQFFPYSVAFVYFEQYLTLYQNALVVLSLCLIIILVVNWLFFGNFILSCYVIASISSILVMLVGLMAWWNIPMNAVSLVNIVIAAGISVEFISNMARGFLILPGTRLEKFTSLLNDTGCSVWKFLIDRYSRESRLLNSLEYLFLHLRDQRSLKCFIIACTC